MLRLYFFYLSNFSIVFFTNIYIANYYLADIFGEYQFYNTLFILFISVSQVGTLQSFTVLAPKISGNIKLIFATLILRVLGYLLVTLLLLVIFWFIKAPNIVYVFLLLFIPLTINLSTILDYYRKMNIDVKYNFVYDGILFSILVIYIIQLDLSIIYIVLARFLSKTISELMKYRYIVKNIGAFTYSRRYLIWMFIKSKVFIVNRIIVELYARSDILLLGLISTKKEVGIYAVSLALYNGLLMGEGLLARKLFPQLTKVFKDDKKVKKVLLLSIIYKGIYFVTIMLVTYYFLNNIIFTYLYNPEEYIKSSIILDIMLIGLFSHIFANNTNYLLMLKDKYLYIKRFSIGLFLNIILGMIFYNIYSLEGYTFAIQIVKIVMVSYSVYVSYKYLNKSIKAII
jgi:O-antigen/teichoic acid export membrane protein